MSFQDMTCALRVSSTLKSDIITSGTMHRKHGFPGADISRPSHCSDAKTNCWYNWDMGDINRGCR